MEYKAIRSRIYGEVISIAPLHQRVERSIGHFLHCGNIMLK